jgi:hypothetical protein
MCRHCRKRCRKCHRKIHSTVPIETVIPAEEAAVLQRTTDILEQELLAVKEQIGLGIPRCLSLPDGTQIICLKGTNEWEVRGKFE